MRVLNIFWHAKPYKIHPGVDNELHGYDITLTETERIEIPYIIGSKF